jgi:hypothetical protein
MPPVAPDAVMFWQIWPRLLASCCKLQIGTPFDTWQM